VSRFSTLSRAVGLAPDALPISHTACNFREFPVIAYVPDFILGISADIKNERFGGMSEVHSRKSVIARIKIVPYEHHPNAAGAGKV